jgi:tetratricopeptide (TPR) repeat protein
MSGGTVLAGGAVLAERFALIEHAGVGGMATVWRAHDHRDKIDVAVKILRAERVDDTARFMREMEVLAELHHPRIVRLIDHGLCDDGRPYMVLEWLDGEDLKRRLLRDRLPLTETLELGHGVAVALAAAHQRGIVHRDIKPANLFLPASHCSGVKVVDFGVARWREVGGLTITGAAVGTPRFMAPEQARGDPNIDSRADVFALGCVLYECISGRQAFSGNDLVALLGKVLLAEVVPLSELVDHVPPELAALIEAMMQKDPQARPADGAAVARALHEVQRDLTRSADEAPPISKRAVAALTESERRLVSVVVVKRAALSTEQGDAADDTLTNESAAAMDKVRVVVEELGGRLHVLRDGSFVAVLLPSDVATDHAARSARCALRAHQALSGVPVALATGRAVFHARLPVGEALEQAAQLLRDDVAGVRIDELTAGLLGTNFELVSDAHGLQLMSERAGAQPLRTLLGKEAPYVGRRREMATLHAVWDECIEDSVARAVMVSGAPGIGKSRLRYELLESLQRRGDPITIAMARGDALNAGTPLALAAQLARSLAGLGDGEGLAVRRDKLRAQLAAIVAPEDAERVTAFIGELVGTPFDDVAEVLVQAAQRDPFLMGDQMRRAFEDLLEASCHKTPTLLVLDDLHWGDRATVKLLDRVLRNFEELPLMVFALSRQSLAQQFEGAWLERDVTQVRLSGLSRRAASTLARAVLSDASEEQLDDIVARADGNAFFLEELLRATTEGWVENTPATVLAMVQARLGALDAPLRRVLRAASVFGRSFWRDGLLALVGGTGSEMGDLLDELEQRELIARNSSSTADAVEYVFRHGLLRDAAVSMLTDDDRQLAHRLAATWLEKRDDSEPFVLAEHFDKGGDVARSARYYAAACEDALEANDLGVAVERAEHAMARGVDGEALGRLHRVLAEVRFWQGELDASRKSANEAVAHLPAGARPWYQVLGRQAELAEKALDGAALERIAALIAETEARDVGSRRLALALVLRSMAMLGDRDQAERLLMGLDTELHEDDAPAVAATIEMARGLLALLRGDLESVYDCVILSREHLLAYGNVRSACLLSSRLGFILNELGCAERAVKMLRDTLGTAERMGIGTVTAHSRNNMGWALAVAGQHKESLLVLQHAADDYERAGDRRMLAGTLEYQARVMLMLGRTDDAEKFARRAVERSVDVASLHPVTEATLARVLLAQGRTDEARPIAQSAYQALGDGQTEGWCNVHLAWAEALWASAECDEARAVAGNARKILLAHTARMRSPEFKRSFIDGVPDHLRLVTLAAQWEGSEAEPVLAEPVK